MMKKLFQKIRDGLKKIRILRSLRFRISILIFLVGSLSLVGMRFGILANYFQRAVEVRTSDVQSQMQILANHLISYQYLDDPSSEVVNAEIEQVANLYDGRIMVIASNFAIIKDTYGVAVGKIIIAEEVIRTFRGDFISHYDDENDYIEITVPITRNVDGKTETVGVILCSVSTTSIVQNEEILSRNSLLFMFIILLVILAVVFFVPRLMLKPFNRLSDAISEVKSGFTDEKIEVNDYIETEHIADSFNQLMERMKVIEESRQEFVSNVSHELKTPLTSVKLLADSLNSQENVPVEIYKDFMHDIVEEIDRENTIINDLLSLVKMDKKSAALNISSVNVNELIESVFKRLSPIAENSSVDLIFESVRQVTADLDEIKFTLAITNLIENGIKYNHEGGYVKVNLNADYQNFIITVSDSGIGIPEEDQKSVFDRFYRVDKSHSREIGGTGLGLSITKSAIVMHRGTIELDSKEDIGTTFTVTVPLIYSVGNRAGKEAPATAEIEEDPETAYSEEEIDEKYIDENGNIIVDDVDENDSEADEDDSDEDEEEFDDEEEDESESDDEEESDEEDDDDDSEEDENDDEFDNEDESNDEDEDDEDNDGDDDEDDDDNEDEDDDEKK